MNPSSFKRTSRSCPRAWEVEAVRDGRLRAQDVDSLHRHLATCDSCRARHARLDALGAVLRDLPAAGDDLLAARRMRHRLFSEADQAIREAPKRASWQRWSRAGVAAAALAACGAMSLSVPWKRTAPILSTRAVQTAAEAPPLKIDVQAQTGAVWHQTQLGGQIRLDLEAGEIRASVGKRLPGQSLVIHLPDGEIDDLGTVLSVRIEDGHTKNVRVFEGRVRLRFDGLSPQELGAGESWTTPPSAPVPALAPSCSTPIPRAVPHPARASSVASRRSRPDERVEPHEPVAQNEATAATPDPKQAREEDRSYLHIVSLLNAHRLPEARAAAKEYLLRFPNGFRREDVLGVATSAGQ